MAEEVYSLEQITDWKSQLKNFAKTPRTRFSKKQAVEAMIEEIEEALESHPYDQVAEMLKGWGLTIAAGSLKQYVNAYRRENGTATPTSSSRRSRTKGKAGKQKSKQTAAVGSKPEAEKQEFEEKTAVQKKATGRKPDAFLDMPEDL